MGHKGIFMKCYGQAMRVEDIDMEMRNWREWNSWWWWWWGGEKAAPRREDTKETCRLATATSQGQVAAGS